MVFRGNQVLTTDPDPDKDEILAIRTGVERFRRFVMGPDFRGAAEFGGTDRIAFVDAFDLFNLATTVGLPVPLRPNIKTNYNGGLFSMDGVHPGFLGHMIIADRIAEAAATKATSRTTGAFGGLPANAIYRPSEADLIDAIALDEVLSGEIRPQQ